MAKSEQSWEQIDFPCAPCWLNHYHRAGLTPRFVEPRIIEEERGSLSTGDLIHIGHILKEIDPHLRQLKIRNSHFKEKEPTDKEQR